jgi:ABC-type amino acid transport/signal transduction systems, periplasmic component/domain
MKNIKIAVILTLVLCLACMAFGCKKTDDSASKKLTVGTSADYPPFEFHILDENNQDKIVGIDISVAQKIADDMGAELVLKDMSFEFIIEELAQGGFDMAIAALETKDGETVSYSDPYYTDYPSMLVIRKADAEKFTSKESFDGATIGVQSGSTKVTLLGETLPNANPLLLTTVPDLVNNVLFSKTDGALIDGSVALAYVAANDSLMVCEAVEFGSAVPYVIAVQKGDPKGLLPSINKSIADAVSKGMIDQWSEEADALSAEAVEE